MSPRPRVRVAPFVMQTCVTLSYTSQSGEKTLLFRRRSVIEIVHSTAFLEACVGRAQLQFFSSQSRSKHKNRCRYKNRQEAKFPTRLRTWNGSQAKSPSWWHSALLSPILTWRPNLRVLPAGE